MTLPEDSGFLAIPSTADFRPKLWAKPQIEAAISIPLLHIADATAEEIKMRGMSTVGLLGTNFTMEQEFYSGRLQKKHRLKVLIPQREDRDIVHRVIYEELVLGIQKPESREEYIRIINALNRQGADVGTQYRSAIYYHDEEQKAIAEEVIDDISTAELWENPIVTELNPLEVFYKAEDYHQDYFANNPNQPYCQAVIAPKVVKFRKAYVEKLKR